MTKIRTLTVTDQVKIDLIVAQVNEFAEEDQEQTMINVGKIMSVPTGTKIAWDEDEDDDQFPDDETTYTPQQLILVAYDYFYGLHRAT